MIETPFPNQPPPLEGRNPVANDRALVEGLRREGAGWSEAALVAHGEAWGSADSHALADAANRNPPELRALDRSGERIDDVEFHPAWHALMRLACAAGEHNACWGEARAGLHVARAAKMLVHGQVENGTQCPVTMTCASLPVLLQHAGAASGPVRSWLPALLAADYDPRPLPMEAKRAALVGMGMTERQGGSDVRSNRTFAEPAGDGTWRLTGHKWFFSVPQADAHLVLAQTEAGLTVFALPRFLPDGSRNLVRLQRLKDKLGNRSNASSEVEFDGAIAWPIGEPGRGIATILGMVQHTRLDCVLGSTAIMRAGLSWALHHARHRVAFGRTLVNAPLMRQVLADMALESEAATTLALRLATLCDPARSAAEGLVARVLVPASKYWICKRAIAVAGEAMEVLGGNGYVEECPLPRLYREAPVNSIWEGSGNVVALDVQRALQRDAGAREAFFDSLGAARRAERRLDRFLGLLEASWTAAAGEPQQARSLAQALVLATQASLLVEHAPAAIADAFCASRLDATAFGGAAFGSLPAGVDCGAILERADAPVEALESPEARPS